MHEMLIGGRSLICALALCVAVVSAFPDCCLTACHESSAQMDMSRMDMSAPMDHHHHHQMSQTGTKTPVLATQRIACQHCGIVEPTFSFASDNGQSLKPVRVAPLAMTVSAQRGTQTVIPDLSPPRSPGVLAASADLPLPLRI
jgi:uncharacterized protein involved in copper resistance